MNGFNELTWTEYCKIDALNQSRLKKILISPKTFKDDISKSSKSMSIGTAIHEFLEIKDLGMFLQEPKVNKRTNKGKEELLEFYDSNSDTDKKIVTTEIYEQLIKVEEGFANHRHARKILNTSKNEITAQANVSGIKAKGCIDLLNLDIGLITDVKSTRRATRQEFERDCITYNYPFQMAFYNRLYVDIVGEEPKHAIITIETHPPFEVSVYFPDYDWMEYGHKKLDHALDIYKECLQNKAFPGKQQNKGELLHLPNYMRDNK